RIICNSQGAVPIVIVPRKTDEVIPGWISVPGGARLPEMESAIMYLGAAKTFEKRFVKGANLRIVQLFWAPAQMHGGVGLPTLHLTFLQKAQTRHKESDYCRRTMHLDRESSGGARLVMIFDEARGVVLIFRVGLKVFAYGQRSPGVEPIVETFIVGEIEPVLLQTPLQVPIDFGHRREPRMPATDIFDGSGPERNIIR